MKDPVQQLSPPQRAVFDELAAGMSTGEIAKKFFRSRKTIDSHILACRKIIGLRHAFALRSYAAQYVLKKTAK